MIRRSLPAAVLLAVAAGSAAYAVPAVTTSVAVVSFGAGGSVPAHLAVTVLSRQPHVGTAVVRGSAPALASLARTPGVRSVVPDATLRPNDSGEHEGSDSVFAWQRLGGGGAAGRPGAGAGVTVALIDTGVSNSAALNRSSGRLLDAVDTSGEGTFADGYGHGTFMAGVVAGGPMPGTGRRSLGVAPGARLVNVKVADATGTTSLAKVVAGLDWVAGHAGTVDVAMFAFSRSRPGPGYGADPLTDAVERVRAAGVTMIVSAGNTKGVVGDPGFDPWIITVGAADVRNDDVTVAPWSGGAVVAGIHKPDLVASGVGVLSVLPPNSEIARANPRSYQGHGFFRGSGTSQATAQTAGVAALFLASFPGATPTQVKASLRAAARPVDGRWSGAGLIRVPQRLRSGGDGSGSGSGSGGTGEGTFDSNSWSSNSWSSNSWSSNSWSSNSWSSNSWSSNSWSASSWSASSWSFGDDGGSSRTWEDDD